MNVTATEENVGLSRYFTYSQMTSNEMNIVNIDHCYSKPWSSHPDASNARPLHMLFMEKFPHLSTQEKQRSTDIIDVVGDDDGRPRQMCDPGKAKALSDYEVMQSDYSDSRDDWEDHIAAVRTTWSVLQNRIFAKVMRVLQADRLARLSIQGIKKEAIQRRLQIDKAAKQVRFSFGSVGWDMTLILWLHNLLLENLTGHLLSSYLEILATLKLKIPSLVEQLIQGTGSKQSFVFEYLSGLMKRNWDPMLSCFNHQKLKKLPDNPLLLLITGAPTSFLNPVAVKRHKFWQHQLSAMGKVINVAPVSNTAHCLITSCVENMITTIRSKILEIKGHFPGRPIILIGWHIGALVAVHVAFMEIVHAAVCLGFPTMGVWGNRGDIDDQIYTCKTPTLFVVGQHASSCSVDILEDIREKLRVETGLVLVGGADDHLRMTRAKKRSCGITQAMVDRCIMDEMFEFLGSILSQTVVQPEVTDDIEIIRKQRKRKQKDIIRVAGSQTGNLPQQTTLRTMRALKLGSGGTLSYGSQWSMAGGTKIVKRPTSKKLTTSADGNSISSKKHTLHLNFSVIETLDDSASLLKVNEAAAIASAPELSSLLQNIQATEQQKIVPDISSSLANNSGATSSCSATITTTAALTLSQFLASSGFFRTDTGVKAKESAENLESASLKSTVGVTEHPQHIDDHSVKQQQQPHIIVQTGTSSVPFSIPLALSVGSKVLQPPPLMRVAGSNSDSPHIQQLLTSVPGSSMSSITAASRTTTVASTTLSVHSNVTQPLSNSLSPITLVPTNSIPLSSGPSTGTLSPGASVVNIDSDTVFMTETPPSTSLMPGTVSIDLGQIAVGTSNVRKLTATPKISLIPTVKQIPASGLTDRLIVPASQTSIAALSSLPHSLLGKPAVTSSKPSVLGNTDSSRPLCNMATSSIKTVSSSQLLSTLSSGKGLIALKLPTHSANSDTSSQGMVLGRDDSGVQIKRDDTFLAHLKGTLNLHGQNVGLSSNIQSKSPGIPKIGVGEHQQQNLLTVASTVSTALLQSPASLIITSGSKLGSGQIVFQCQRTGSNTPQPSTVKCSSPLPCGSTATETLGQVTSLLESSPVKLLDNQKPQTLDSESICTLTKQTNKELSSTSLQSSFPSTLSNTKTKTVISSYTATPKPVLPTTASTRTRRIKTPKQYDL